MAKEEMERRVAEVFEAGDREELTRLMQRFDEFAHGCAGFG
jgi:hypothetical protein